MFIAPPLFRHQPAWYQRGLTQIASRFSTIFTNSPPNLSLLPSFASQDLLPDGRFLTPVSGLHYVLHLFDQTEILLKNATISGDAQLSMVQEQVRHHEDRMTYLEGRHCGLQKQVCRKVAVDAEFDDWMQNRSEENWLVIRGLPRLNVPRQAWPDAARRQVADMIKLVLTTHRVRLDFEVIAVYNPFSRTNTGPTLYNVKMDSVYSSERVRDLFSGFFRHNRPAQLPSSLKGVEVRNKITLETKIRIAILRQLGVRYQDSNPGSSFKIRGYDPRPTLVTTPPRSSTERGRTYNFIQAVTTLPAAFTDENLAPIFQTIGDRFRGRLQDLFVVLNDDDHDRCLELAKNYARVPRRGQASGFNPGPTSSSTSVGQVHGRGAGMEVETRSGLHIDPSLISSIRPIDVMLSSIGPIDKRSRRSRRSRSSSRSSAGSTRSARSGRSARSSSSSSSPPRSKKSKKHKHKK